MGQVVYDKLGKVGQSAKRAEAGELGAVKPHQRGRVRGWDALERCLGGLRGQGCAASLDGFVLGGLALFH